MSVKCADIADPSGFIPPAWIQAVQGYVGERLPIRTPTPHIWSKADWSHFPTMRKYPMFVGTPAVGAAGNVVTEAFECMQNLWEIGCTPGHVVGLDMETAVNRVYVTNFYRILHAHGYKVWVYGSASSVFLNPKCDGYDPADWTGIPHFVNHANVVATQYADAATSHIGADLRVIRWWQWKRNMWL